MNYRDRIYASYGEKFQDATPSFDRSAAQRWGRARNWHLRHWLPASKDAHIVDLACGGGKLLHFFAEKGYQNITGVDISPDQVALSKQVTPNVHQADVIEFLEVHPSQFDLITGFDIIEHFYKDEVLRFLDAAYAALKPGGRLILQTPNAESPWGAQHRYNDFTHEVGFNPNALVRLMQLVGLKEVQGRECDPAPVGYSLLSSLRAALWFALRLRMFLFNLIETGSLGDGVYTRVFLASGIK